MLPHFSVSQGNISRVAESSRDSTQPLCATHSHLKACFTLAVFQCLCPSGPTVSSAPPELLPPQRCHKVPGMRRPRLADFLLLLTFPLSFCLTLSALLTPWWRAFCIRTFPVKLPGVAVPVRLLPRVNH